jgi:hypothetical protein
MSILDRLGGKPTHKLVKIEKKSRFDIALDSILEEFRNIIYLEALEIAKENGRDEPTIADLREVLKTPLKLSAY